MKLPKVYAIYLPQFHRVKENDMWWGEGFTEWRTVENATALFEGHNQPLKPIHCYNLLDKKTMQQQANYMHQYGIDGMCFYHYYFENGRKILEKPAENLLTWTEINMPFCFYWANESWVRSWSNIVGNCWSEINEKSVTENENGILLKQDYGTEQDWREHFQYMLPFFKDERYLKKDGKPIFIIYEPNDIECLEDMKKCWDKLITEAGLPGIYYIGKRTDKGILDAALIQEPQAAMRHKFYQNDKGIRSLQDFDNVWENILKMRKGNTIEYLCGFPGYDDTPRHGRNGTVVMGATPQKFKDYMIRLLLKSCRRGNDFLFVNAWNEWGEGMYLEPDTRWQFQYLEALRDAKNFVELYGELVLLTDADDASLSEQENSEIEKLNRQCNKYRNFIKIFERMLNLKLNGKLVSRYISEKRYDKVAIYGLGIVGKALANVLEEEAVNVIYGIDRDKYQARFLKFPLYSLEKSLENVDIIIVTVEDDYTHIRKELESKTKAEIVNVGYLLNVAERDLI